MKNIIPGRMRKWKFEELLKGEIIKVTNIWKAGRVAMNSLVVLASADIIFISRYLKVILSEWKSL